MPNPTDQTPVEKPHCLTHVYDACSATCQVLCRCGHLNARHDTSGFCFDCGTAPGVYGCETLPTHITIKLATLRLQLAETTAKLGEQVAEGSAVAAEFQQRIDFLLAQWDCCDAKRLQAERERDALQERSNQLTAELARLQAQRDPEALKALRDKLVDAVVDSLNDPDTLGRRFADVLAEHVNTGRRG